MLRGTGSGEPRVPFRMRDGARPMFSAGPTAPDRRPYVVRYPLPFVAGAGLGSGAVVIYLLHRAALGDLVWLGFLFAGGLPLVYRTGRRALRGEYASDLIAALAIVGALLLDQAFAGLVIVLMQSGGEALDSYAFHRASASLRALLDRAPRSTHRREGDSWREVPVEAVRPGDRLLVRPGELVPVDGTIRQETALLDESAVTGEPFPRRHPPGEDVASGVVNVGGAFELEALRPAAESQYARIVELVRGAQERKPPIQRLADRYATWFTPLTLLVAALGWAITATPESALAVLVVATPCPLIIATPIAIIGAVNRAADRGIVVKTGGAIEEIGRARTVLFDKTGTLTSGTPEAEEVTSLNPGIPPVRVLSWAAAVEQASSHPLAEAVVRRAVADGVPRSAASAVEEFAGSGVRGRVEGHVVMVGSRRLIAEMIPALAAETLPRPAEAASGPARLVAYVAVDGAVVGRIVFADRLRPGATTLVPRLFDLGVRRVGLLTGDSLANATAIARQAGIPSVHAELRPEEKVALVRQYREQGGRVVMVGDGINDAAALAAASVGVAMGARGAGISTEAADIVLLVDDVTRVPEAVALGQRMLRIARQGIWFGLGASILLMGLAALGHVLPAIGAVLQEAVDVSVILNALRVRGSLVP